MKLAIDSLEQNTNHPQAECIPVKEHRTATQAIFVTRAKQDMTPRSLNGLNEPLLVA